MNIFSQNVVDTIMLFAAGRGTRMQHITGGGTPKPLVNILGKPMLHYALDLCKVYPFKKIVVNTHYLPDKVEASLEEYRRNNPQFPQILTIYEQELRETGGAVKNAQDILGDNPVFTLNTDVILQTDYNVFEDMLENWDPAKMNFLLLVQPYGSAAGYGSRGDFEMDQTGRLTRPDSMDGYPFMYAGLTLLKPDQVRQDPRQIFSLRDYYFNDKKVFGILAKEAGWYHATSPEDLAIIENELRVFLKNKLQRKI